jgi:hypothetical protein
MSRWAIWSGSVIGSGSGRSGLAFARNLTCPTFVIFMSHLHSLDIAQPWLPHNVGLWREIAGGRS